MVHLCNICVYLPGYTVYFCSKYCPFKVWITGFRHHRHRGLNLLKLVCTYQINASCTFKIYIRVITKLPNSEQSYKGKVKTDKISQQTENCENRNGPDLVQVFLKKCWVESDFKAPNLPLSLRLKVSGCHCNSKLKNILTGIVHQISKTIKTIYNN